VQARGVKHGEGGGFIPRAQQRTIELPQKGFSQSLRAGTIIEGSCGEGEIFRIKKKRKGFFPKNLVFN
jgi:hypothetical protein